MAGRFVCRVCGSEFFSLRSARLHLRSCFGSDVDLSSYLDYKK